MGDALRLHSLELRKSDTAPAPMNPSEEIRLENERVCPYPSRSQLKEGDADEIVDTGSAGRAASTPCR
jgi:hypothetical protein